jgi:hypothetical protein
MSNDLIDPKRFHQLFVDDFAVDSITGATRTLHSPRKWGPVITGGIQSRTCPQWNSEKNLWEWWYFGENVYYATSEDGEHWEQPNLGLFEWKGSKENNIAYDPAGQAAFDPNEKSPGRLYHIVRDETDPDPDRRYKGMLSASNRYPAVSPDGFHWNLVDTPPIPSQDESQFTHDHQTNQFLAFVKLSTEWGRSVWLSTSTDFRKFTEPKLVFHTDEIDRENRRRRVREVIDNPAYITPPIIDDEDYIAECYNMAVLPYQGFYIGFPTIFNPFGACPPPGTNYTRINQIEMTVSRDLYHWERVADRALFIGLEPFDGENYGCNQLLMAGHPIVRDDGEIWCYYNALRCPGDIEQYKEFGRGKELFRLNAKPEHFEDGGALTLAKLRPDGFVSLDGGECGTMLSKPFELKGEDVYINADASWGEIYAEIVDGETRKPHDGFWVPGESPEPFTGDSTKAKVKWKHPHDLVFEKPVRLKLYLRQARLYSFWIE